jgi:DtxR family Mn-dependent transcriptional regulator
MQEYLTQTVEDYLKAIYKITATYERASTNQIAESLGVAPASVTGMIKKLSKLDPPLLNYKRHNGVVLTPDGEKIALEIIRHHRLIEMFLHETLGYRWDEVHEEADRLEHVISEEFEERIAAALGDPVHDPHGDPIPSRDLFMPDTSFHPLSKSRTGQGATILRVRDENPELLRYLSDRGVIPQARLTILDYSPFDENVSLLVEGQEQPIVLGPKITKEIFVEYNVGINADDISEIGISSEVKK